MLSKMPSFQQQKNMIHAKKQEIMIGEGKKKKKRKRNGLKEGQGVSSSRKNLQNNSYKYVKGIR